MTHRLTVSPDFSTKYLAGWFIFNNWMQHALENSVHLDIYDDFAAQRRAIDEGRVDLIYANPYDATALVRTHGFVPVVRPRAKADEALIAVSAASAVQAVEDLEAGVTIATTSDPDVHMMGMIMLEPADLDASSIALKTCDNYVLVAKELMRGNAAAGFFLEEVYGDLSAMIRDQLRVLVRSQIQLVHHLFLVGPRLAEDAWRIQRSLLAMNDSDKGRAVLSEIGVAAWDATEQEDVEFMIDLMDTLVP